MNIFRNIYNNAKIRYALAACACLWVAVFIQIVVTYAFAKEVNITQAYSATDNIDINKCVIENTACLLYDKQYFDVRGNELLNAIASYFECIDNKKPVIEYRSLPVPCYKYHGVTEDFDIVATVSWSDEMKKAYLHCYVNVISNLDKAKAAHDYINSLIDGAKKDNLISNDICYMRVNGAKNGKMSQSECEAYTDTLFERLEARHIDSGTGNYYTEYGYTPGISDSICSNNNVINVQVSYNYDEKNDRTEISLGSPILNGEY